MNHGLNYRNFEDNNRNWNGNRPNNYNNYSRPYFGPRDSNNNNNNNYNYRNPRNYNNRPYQNRYQGGGSYYPRQNQNYNYNYNQYPEQNYDDFHEDNDEREKIEEEKKFRNKYESFIEKIESVFYGQVTKDEVLNIIKSLIKMPSLTVFEAMNLIYRQVKIYQALNYYKNKDDRLMALDGDIFENKYPEEYPTESLNKIIESYKINKRDEQDEKIEIENSYFLYENEEIDMRRKIYKNKDGIYNYLPILLDKKLKLNEEYLEKFEKLEIFAKNEYEINYHPLYYKTMMCNSCIKEGDNDYLIKPLCPYSHDIQNEFRIIYDYKDLSICELMKSLSTSDLFTFENYLKYIPMEINIKEKGLLQTFKVHKCQLDKSCPNDYHLCPFYHESQKSKDQKRRPPFLFRYSSEICDYCFDKVKNKYIVENCPYGDFCTNIHNKNEYNYHKEHFGKIFKCTRSPIGKCPFRKTCYGIHKEYDIDNDEEEEESEEESIDEEKLEDEEINDKKEKNENILKISKCFRCRKCNYLKNSICFFKDCDHFLCINCLKKLLISYKKAKKERNDKNKDNNLQCPFCNKELSKGKIIKYEFSKN